MAEQANKTESTKGEQPRKRIKLGARNVLTAPKRPGFVRRFVNDTGDRIQAFKDAGWTVADDVTKVGDAKLGKAALTGSMANPSVGGGTRAVLMDLPEEIYEADRAESQAEITKVEQEMKRNINTGSNDGLSGEVKIG
jgi:hypothetical protein